MPIYISLINWTEQGLKNAKESPKRFALAKQAIEKAGVKFHSVHYTFGRYDMIGILPDSRLEVIQSGHFPQFEKPEVLNSKILDFLELQEKKELTKSVAGYSS